MPAQVQIVLPSFNRPHLCNIAIKSVLAQTFKDWKLYVMDNSSPQLQARMNEIYTYYSKRDSRIVVDCLEVPNEARWIKPWVSVVTNRALFKLSEKEPFVVLSADDCYLMPKKLEILRTYLLKHASEMCVAGKCEVYDRKGKTVNVLGGKDFQCARNMLDWVQPMFRREILEYVMPLPEKLGYGSPDGYLYGMIGAKCASKWAIMRGLNVTLDKVPKWTKQTYFTPALKAKAQRGERMDT